MFLSLQGQIPASVMQNVTNEITVSWADNTSLGSAAEPRAVADCPSPARDLPPAFGKGGLNPEMIRF